MTIKKFISFLTNRFLWLNILAMIVVAGVLFWGTMKWIDSYTRHGEAVVVPDVKGMTVPEASALFQKTGLAYVVSDSTYVKDQPAGVILEVKPEEGLKVKEGRTVYLTINTLNIPLHTIPDVADNSSLRQAQARVLASGFKLDSVEYIAGEKDWVYGVKYRGHSLETGDRVPLGAILTLIVGNGEDEAFANDSLSTDSVEVMEPTPVTDSTTEEESWF